MRKALEHHDSRRFDAVSPPPFAAFRSHSGHSQFGSVLHVILVLRVGVYISKITLGLGLRHEWGTQYTADQFQGEIRWLGIRSTPSHLGEPECNGVTERFMRTLKEA